MYYIQKNLLEHGIVLLTIKKILIYHIFLIYNKKSLHFFDKKLKRFTIGVGNLIYLTKIMSQLLHQRLACAISDAHCKVKSQVKTTVQKRVHKNIHHVTHAIAYHLETLYVA